MGIGRPRCRLEAARAWVLGAALCAAAVGLAAAEDGKAPAAAAPAAPAPAESAAPPTSAATAPPAAPAPTAADRPGFLHQLREWWDQSLSGLSAGMQDARSKVENLNQKSTEAAKNAASATQDAVKNAATATQDAMKSTAEATKDAASTLFKLPNTRVIEIRERCPPAPNGAPDCQTAAANACSGKGFGGGQPLDVVSTEKCPPATVLSAQRPGETECPVETVVSRAICR